ncbi:MAG TPA: oligosaccharide repeat unit polymerase, partial [Ramlibacter sp.]|nr:oligosaccharide repeat unit polymerase [Ramlibacter sp.]
MEKPDRLRDGPLLVRKLPWWTRPSALTLLFVLPALILVIWAGGSGMQVRSRNYISAPYIALYVGLVLVSAVGAWLGENIQQRATLQSPVQHLTRAAIWVGALVLATYLFWYRSLMFNPALLMSVLLGGVKPERTDIGTVAGITSLVNVAPVFFALAGYVLFVRRSRDRTLVALTIVLALFTLFRAYIWSERLAVVEAVIPLALALLGNASLKPHQRARKWLLRLGPYAALPVVFVFFAVAEFFRSWSYYEDRMGFWQFASDRFVSYYYTSFNNGAGMLATADWPTGTFDEVLHWLHAFPLGIGAWFSDTVGLRTSVGEVFLQRYGDPEFNTGSAFAGATLDLGVAGATLYFFLSMFCSGILYSRYLKNDLLSVMLFPSVLVAMLEGLRYPYWGTSRAFVWLMGSLVVLAMLWVCGSIRAATPSCSARRPGLHEAAQGRKGRGNVLIAAVLAFFLATDHPSANAQTPAAAGAIQLADYGAVCDGATDDSPAIARALAQARTLRLPLFIPAARCAFGDIIRVDGATLTGAGEASVLHALDWRRSAIFMSGAGPVVSNLKLTGVAAPLRQARWESTKITVFGATDFVIDRVVIDGSPAAGIQTAQGATRGRITNNVVRNTLSDGIHLTGAASHLLVEGNLVESTGDDGIAVVSYKYDRARVNNITARNNVVRNNRNGRNLSIIGGAKVVYENNLLQNNLAGNACLYIAQENNYNTYSVVDAKVSHNTFENCGSLYRGHAAAMIFSDGGEANNNITLLRNDIIQKFQNGIRYFGPQTDIRVEQNR